jgi:DNA-binding transcriptional regulator YiaG
VATRLERPPAHLIRTREDRDAAKVALERLDAGGNVDGIPNTVLRKVLSAQLRAVSDSDLPRRRRARPARRAEVLPRVTAEDAAWVPPALKHYRAVHHLTQKQASIRIGYSAEANPWKDWEQGRSLPPYQTLLAIIAATGMMRLIEELHPPQAPLTLRISEEQRASEARMAQLAAFRGR